jgi:hypothetical protein
VAWETATAVVIVDARLLIQSLFWEVVAAHLGAARQAWDLAAVMSVLDVSPPGDKIARLFPRGLLKDAAMGRADSAISNVSAAATPLVSPAHRARADPVSDSNSVTSGGGGGGGGGFVPATATSNGEGVVAADRLFRALRMRHTEPLIKVNCNDSKRSTRHDAAI